MDPQPNVRKSFAFYSETLSNIDVLIWSCRYIAQSPYTRTQDVNIKPSRQNSSAQQSAGRTQTHMISQWKAFQIETERRQFSHIIWSHSLWQSGAFFTFGIASEPGHLGATQKTSLTKSSDGVQILSKDLYTLLWGDLLLGSNLSSTSHCLSPCAWAQTFGVWDVHLATSNGLKCNHLFKWPKPVLQQISGSWRGMSWNSKTTLLDTSNVFVENRITIWLTSWAIKFEDPVCHR